MALNKYFKKKDDSKNPYTFLDPDQSNLYSNPLKLNNDNKWNAMGYYARLMEAYFFDTEKVQGIIKELKMISRVTGGIKIWKSILTEMKLLHDSMRGKYDMDIFEETFNQAYEGILSNIIKLKGEKVLI